MVLTCQQLSYTQITCMLLKTMSFGKHLSDLKTTFPFPHWEKEILKYWNILLAAELTSSPASMDYLSFFAKRSVHWVKSLQNSHINLDMGYFTQRYWYIMTISQSLGSNLIWRKIHLISGMYTYIIKFWSFETPSKSV